MIQEASVGRYSSGKRKRQLVDRDGMDVSMIATSGEKQVRRKFQNKNALQAALYGGGEEGGGNRGKKFQKKNRKSR